MPEDRPKPDDRTEVWQGLRRHMSQAEVRAVLPSAVDDPEPTTIANGAKSLLHVPDYEFAGNRFEAQIYFNEEKLQQVMLALISTGKGCRALKRAADQAIAALRDGQHREVRLEVKDSDGKYDVYGEWLKGKANVAIVGSCLAADDPGMMNVVYQTRFEDGF